MQHLQTSRIRLPHNKKLTTRLLQLRSAAYQDGCGSVILCGINDSKCLATVSGVPPLALHNPYIGYQGHPVSIVSTLAVVYGYQGCRFQVPDL